VILGGRGITIASTGRITKVTNGIRKSLSREGTARYEPPFITCSRIPFASSYRPCPFVALTLSRLLLFIFALGPKQRPHTKHLPQPHAKACNVTRTTDVIRVHLGLTRSPAPTPRHLVQSQRSLIVLLDDSDDEEVEQPVHSRDGDASSWGVSHDRLCPSTLRQEFGGSSFPPHRNQPP